MLHLWQADTPSNGWFRIVSICRQTPPCITVWEAQRNKVSVSPGTNLLHMCRRQDGCAAGGAPAPSTTENNPRKRCALVWGREALPLGNRNFTWELSAASRDNSSLFSVNIISQILTVENKWRGDNVCLLMTYQHWLGNCLSFIKSPFVLLFFFN